MRVLTNTADLNAPKTYFKRWEIEQVFKTMKQEFDLEKIRTLSLRVLDNTVAIIQLAVAISNAVFNAQNQFRNTRILSNMKGFEKRFKYFARRNGLTMNRNSIITFISSLLETSFKYRYKPRIQKTINTNP
jgi:hypothetical protein